ncbi:Coenzyme F420 hydrogenase/dehydrogenase, beta subunit C-terminal domain [Gammaproteobacteria bacterium]|nr:Coenzyme F420 hydrogenase/dehydrogenase, beta subunit C-terminal domain [Gammaproteobacteria bacterium]
MDNLISHRQIITTHKQVVSEIVDNDLCIGCGICVGICPSNLLEMSWQDNGDLAPEIDGKCPPSCNACLTVCPFGDYSLVETSMASKDFGHNNRIKKDLDLGLYLETYVGHSLIDHHRKNGASGGMTTWFLESLLETKAVDAIISINQSNDQKELFEFQAIDNIQTIQSAAGSVYHPVDMANVINQMNLKGIEKNYAVVGLPCFIKGIKLAMQTMPRLRRRIKFTIGLTCGHLPNKFYTEYLSEISGVNSDELQSVDYRIKKKTTRAGNFKFQATSNTTNSGSELAFSDISNIWGAGHFGMNACNFCDDVFSELADLSVMDAWLPEYEHDIDGSSLMIIRNQELVKLLLDGMRLKTCKVDSIDATEVKKSQSGVIFHKKYLLEARLFWAGLKGLKIPKKRVQPNPTVYEKHKWQIAARFAVQSASKRLWPKVNKRNIKLFSFYIYCLSLPIVLFKFVTKVGNFFKNPKKIRLFFKRK